MFETSTEQSPILTKTDAQMPKYPKFQFCHIPSLDGLRGIAIILVILAHARVPLFPGGAIGVDVFFVLSGFLITSLLWQEFERHGNINLKLFYIKRLLRLFPALALLLICYVIASILFYENSAKHLVAAAWASSYVANWAIIYNWAWHGLMAVSHTWSLSVEEQFYILWPPVLIFLLKATNSPGVLAATILCSSTTSYLWRVYCYAHGASIERVYFGSDTRADGLLLGSAIAVVIAADLLPRRLQGVFRKSWPSQASILGILLISTAWEWQDSRSIYLSHYLTSLITGVLIISVVLNKYSAVSRALCLPVLIRCGKLSYGMYLWQGPIFATLYSKSSLPCWAILVLGSMATATMASLSYHLVERRFLALKTKLK